MPYHGPGFYRHYKGGLYEVMGLGLKEDTVIKPDNPKAGPEVTCVVYYPLTEGSLLENRDEKFWLRELVDFNAYIYPEGVASSPPGNVPRGAPRFTRIACPQCQDFTNLRPVGGGMLVCETCGSNTGVGV